MTTSSYTATGLAAGNYSFYVQSYTGSGSSVVLSNPSNTVSVTLGSTTPTEPDTPAGELPTSSTPITGITLTPANDGRHYTLKWDDVSGAFYTVQMRDPQTNRWTTVRQKLTSARTSPDVTETQMGISCSTDADQATTVGWAAVSGATSYEVRNELTYGSGGGHDGNYPAGLDFLSRQRRGRRADMSLPESATGAKVEGVTK